MLPIHSLPPAASQGVAAVASPATSQNSKPVDAAEEAKLKKAGGDFESILLASMWKSMKQTFGDPNESATDPASGTLNDWGIEVMSGAVGKAGGLGIGNVIVKYLEQHGSVGDSHATTPLGKANVSGKSADNSE
jgi:Rod binding domain-containing protein